MSEVLMYAVLNKGNGRLIRKYKANPYYMRISDARRLEAKMKRYYPHIEFCIVVFKLVEQ